MKQTVDYLQNSIKALTALLEPINCMNNSLSALHDLTKEKLQLDLDSFIKYTKKNEAVFRDIQMTDILREMIGRQTEEIRKYTYIIQDCSSTYVEITDRHLKKPVGTLSQLVYLTEQMRNWLSLRH